jgi:hypothetical protein
MVVNADLCTAHAINLSQTKFAGARSTRTMSLCFIEMVRPSFHSIVTPLHATSMTVPRSAAPWSQQTRLPTLSCLDCSPVI